MTPKKISKGVRAAVAKFKASQSEGKVAAQYRTPKKKIVCTHCGSDQFRKSQLSSFGFAGGTVSAPDAKSGLHALICAECTCVSLFEAEPLAE